MKTLILTCTFVMMAASMAAQKAKEIVVGPDQSFPFNEKYRFPEFRSGFIITRDGKRSKPLKLNYNIFSGTPQFLDEKGDTLFIDAHLAKYVQIEDVTFLHEFSRGYYELVLKTTPVRLAKSTRWKRTRVETIFNEEGRGGGVDRSSFSRSHKNTIYSKKAGGYVRNENVVFRRDTFYYLVDDKDRILRANEANLIRLFPAQKKQLQDWIAERKVRFDDESSLNELFAFLIPLVN